MDGFDDLGVVDALQVDRRDPEVAVPKLALNDYERHALMRELDARSGTAMPCCGRGPDGLPYPIWDGLVMKAIVTPLAVMEGHGQSFGD